MRLLALVDLDNVLGWFGKAGQPFDGRLGPLEPELPRGLRADAPGVRHVIAIAMNTTTARSGGVTWETVQRFSARLIGALGVTRPDAWEIEPALTLTMPESADLALHRLARESPRPSVDGPFQTVLLLSDDRGLVAGVSALAGGPPGNGSSRAHCWTGLDHARTRPTGRSVPTGDVSETFTCTLRASTAVDGTRVELQPPLEGIARAVERRPWKLSQVGVTTHGVRSVAHLSTILTASSVNLRCRSADGAEVTWHTGARTFAVVDVIPSTVGIGAVTLAYAVGARRGIATVRTRLPLAVVERGAPGLTVRWSPDNDDTDDAVIVAAALKNGLRRLPEVRADLSELAGKGLRCVLEIPAGQEPEAWWCWEDFGRPRTTTKYEDGGRTLRCPDRIDGIDAVPELTANTEIVFRSALDGDAPRVTPDRPISPGFLGPAVGVRTDGRPVRCAVLALGAALAPGAAIPCKPIQDVDTSLLRQSQGNTITGDEIASLKRLPIVVPR